MLLEKAIPFYYCAANASPLSAAAIAVSLIINKNVAVMTSARTLYAARNSMQYIKKLLQTSLVFAIMAKSLV